MTDLTSFKNHVEELLDIAWWEPSQHQLIEIAREFARNPPRDRGEALAIVKALCPAITFKAFEGVDNSDLRALLALAIVAAKR